MRGTWLIVLALVGCKRSEEAFGDDFPAWGVSTLTADVEVGDFYYEGSGGDSFQVTGTSYGTGFSATGAEKSREGNQFSMVAVDGEMQLVATSAKNGGGVDFEVVGPPQMDTIVSVDTGAAHLDSVDGSHVVNADEVMLTDVRGSVDALAEEGELVAELIPSDGDVITLEASAGGMTLTLPYGLAYNLQVWYEPENTSEFADLGFDDISWSKEDGYFSGVSGGGWIEVAVHANGGTFTLVER